FDAQEVFVHVVIGVHAHDKAAVGVANADVAGGGQTDLLVEIDDADPTAERFQYSRGIVGAAVIHHENLEFVTGHTLVEKTANCATNVEFRVMHRNDDCDLHVQGLFWPKSNMRSARRGLLI